MKNKFGKRVLSLLLSALMVVTSIPLVAMPITAFADSVSVNANEHLVAEYLVNDATTGLINHNVDWDSAKKEAHFKGGANGNSYLELTNNPFNEVSSSTGFTVSFDFYKENTNDSWARFFEFGDGTASNYYSINAGQTDYTSLESMCMLNGVQYNYYPIDLGNANYTVGTGTAFSGQLNAWHNLTVSMDANGYYYYVLDGTLMGKYKSDYINSSDNRTIIKADFLNKLSKFTTLYLGYDNYNDACFTGYMKNFRVFNTGYESLTDAERLLVLMGYYEAKMNGTVYTNMSAAYTAYVNACKAYDAYIYGRSDTAVASAATALNTAIANMTEWTPIASTGQAYWYYENTVMESGFWSNVLYEDSYVNWGGENDADWYHFELLAPRNVVLLNDGINDSSFPVKMHVKRNSITPSKRTQGPFKITTTNFKLQSNWQFASTDAATVSNFSSWPGGNGAYIPYDDTGTRPNNVDHKSERYYVNRMYLDTAVYSGALTTDNDCYGLVTDKLNINVRNADSYTDAPCNCNVYSVNYKHLVNAIDLYKQYIVNIDSYRQNGLQTTLEAFDKATSYNPNTYFTSASNETVSDCVYEANQEILLELGAFSTAKRVADKNYSTLRSDMTDGLSNTFGTYGTATAKELFDNAETWSKRLANWDIFFEAYTNAKNHMASLPSSSYNADTAASLATALENAFGILSPKSTAAAPTIEGNTFLGPNDEITIASAESGVTGTVTYKVFYDGKDENGAADYTGTLSYNSSTTYAPFTSKAHTSVMVVAQGTDGNGTTDSIKKTFYYIGAPVISGAENNALVPVTKTVTAAKNTANSTENGYGNIVLKYSYDGTNWNNYKIGDDIKVFPATGGVYPSISTVQVKAVYKEGSVESTSDISSITLARESDFAIYADTAGKHVYNGNSIIYMYKTDDYQDDIIYQIYADGSETPSAWFVYDKANGLDLSSSGGAADILNNASYVTIKAISRDKSTHSYTDTVTETFYNTQDRNDLIYHESFDGSTSGSTYTSADSLGVTLDLGTDGSIVSKAGDLQGTGNGESGTTTDYRSNVLKINANTSEEKFVTFSENPFAGVVNKNFAQSQGVTISFWRAFNNSGTAGDLGEKSGWNGVPNWRNVLSVRPSGAAVTQDKYLRIEASAEVDYSVTGAQDYLNLLVDKTDETTHSASTQKGYWEHIAVTFAPSGEVTVYVNGVPHKTTAYVDDTAKSTDDSNIYRSGVNAAFVKDVISFITDSNNVFYFGHDNGWDMGLQSTDLYIDDVRFYTNVLTQEDIWNTYTDEYSDTPTLENNYTAVTHDPTTVTVYTVEGLSSTVGQEYIDLHPDAVITGREYYSFGTGMQIYRSADNINWTIVADSKGRVAYQNQELFGAEYHEALAEVLNEIKNTTDASSAAGHLVWAPHVMYNVTTGKWMMYAAISYWGNCNSDIIALESSDGTPVHFKARNDDGTQAYQIIMKSESRPNAIDACVFYGHNSDGSIDPNTIYMTYGAWSAWGFGEQGYNLDNDLFITTRLNANGYVDSTLDNVGVGQSEIAASQPYDTTGEGSYVIYKDGYYYLFAAYGVNDYNYMTRVYRSKDPVNEDFVDYNGVDAKDETQFHGTQIMAPYYLPGNNYIYMSTGHNSVYKTVNNNGEEIYLNSTHARPVSNKANDYRQLPDVAMATRQLDLAGNVTLTNPIFFTSEGWPIVMPKQYDGTETSKNILASDLDGIYSALTLYDIIDFKHVYSETVKNDGAISDNFNTSLKLMFSATSVREGRIYGSTAAGYMPINFTYKLENNGNNTFIHIYSGDTLVADGVAVMRDGVPELAYFNKELQTGLSAQDTRAGATIWATRIDSLPAADQESMGDSVSMDGVIYTHATDAEVLALAGIDKNNANAAAVLASGYAVYGQEISDNFTYGQNDYASGGERYTTITVNYPAYIDTTQSNAIYCTNDEDYTSQGYLAGAFSLTPLKNNQWYSVDSGGTTYYYATDEEAKQAYEDEHAEVKRMYMVQGSVSNYFAYDKTAGKYREGGVEFLVQYKNIETGEAYGEYEYCYVTPNPAWAHTMAATRNTSSEFGNDRKSSVGNFNRFLESYGEATDYSSSVLYYAANGTTEKDGWGVGTSGYLTDFSTSAKGKDLSSLDKIETLFNKYDKSVGATSGSYSVQEHNNSGPNAYIATPQLINVQYYVDYSDYNNYIKNNPNGLIRTSENNTSNVPIGYQFKMETSNFLWNTTKDGAIMGVSSYARNTTGLNVTYSSSDYTLFTNNESDNYPSGYVPRYTGFGWGDVSDEAKAAGILRTNPDEIQTYVVGTASGSRYWPADELLFFTDCRNTNSSFDLEYRNRFLYFFTGMDNNKRVLTTDRAVDEKQGNFLNDTNNNRPYTYDYTSQKAYPTYSNGKDDTNNWQGVATFTGVNSIKQNKVDGSVYDTDGYYYYYKTNDVDKESWTTDKATAEGSSNGKYGNLDITAETLANYILELGNVHKVYWSSRRGGSFVGNETYHYYNIGVATCDKGAARTFAETYLNKNLKVDKDGKVVLDKNGVPTIEERTGENGKTTALNSGEFSIASYKEYLDAIAECFWFVENPKNTTFADFKDSGSDADTSYTTAYSNDGTPIYVTDVEGKNIFKDGTTTTDEVQAKLIENVIKAYENLFNKEDYKEVEETYIDKRDTAQVLSSDIYTQESIDFYNEILDLFKIECEYYTDKDKASDADISGLEDIDGAGAYWRNVSLSGAEYKEILEALKSLDSVPMLKVDTDGGEDVVNITLDGDSTATDSNIRSAIAAKTDAYNAGLGTKASQNSTVSAWLELKDAYEAAQATVDTVDNAESNNADLGRYATEAKSLTFSTKTLEYTLPTSDYSDLQIEINTNNKALANADIKAVDLDERYQNYNTAQSYTSKIDRSVYTATALNNINSLVNLGYSLPNGTESAPIYGEASDDIINNAVYVNYNNTVYKNTGLNETDAKTAYVLNTLNDVDAQISQGNENLVDCNVTFYKVVDGVTTQVSTQTVKFGTAVTLTYSGAENDQIISWAVEQNGARTAKKITTATYIYYATAASANVYVNVFTENAQENSVNVTVKDYFDKAQTVSVPSGTTVSVNSTSHALVFSDGTTVSAPKTAYITFDKWTVNGADLTDGYEVTEPVIFKAVGTKADGTVSYSVSGGKFADGNRDAVYKADEKINITADGDCIGIAVKTDSGYELVTYGSTYEFFGFPAGVIDNVEFLVVTDDNKSDVIGDDYDIGVFAPVTYSGDRVVVYALATVGNLPSGVTVTERGMLLTKGDHTDDGFTKGSAGSRAYLSTADVTSPFYMISAKCTNTSGVYARAYVSYNKTVTLAGTTATLPLIVYGKVYSVAELAQ